MTSLFISYSRKDIEIAKKLTKAFKGQDLDFWIDWEGIPPTVDWWKEIERGIEQANVFVCLISPDSARSKVCHQEIDHAVKNGKRLIPVVVRNVKAEEAPDELRPLNWIFIREEDDFDTNFGKLITAVKTDYEWVQTHSQLQIKAREWERNKRENGFLLHGKELQDAEIQLVANSSKEPHPTDLQREYILRSRRTTDRQRRTVTSVSITGLIILAVLAIYAFAQASLARTSQATAEANAASAQTAQVIAENNENARATAQALAEERANISLARQLTTQAQSISTTKSSNQLIASLLNIQSMRLFPTTDAAHFLLNSYFAESISQIKQDGGISSIDLSPDGKYLVFISGNKAYIRDILTGKEVSGVTHDDIVRSVTFSPDGEYIVSGSNDHTVRIWQVSTGKEISRMTHDGPVTSVAFSPDGKYVASSSEDATARLWDVFTGTEILRIENRFNMEILSVAFSPDGRYLVSGDGNESSARIWNISTGREIARIPHDSAAVLSVQFSHNGKFLVSLAMPGTISIWEPATGREIAHIPNELGVFDIALSPDDKYIVSAGGGDFTARVWEISTGREIAHMAHDSYISSVAFSPDGNFVISGGGDFTARVWETSTGREIARMTHDGDVNSVTFSKDGKFLISGSADGTIRVWKPATIGEISKIAYEGGIRNIGFNPRGDKFISISNNPVNKSGTIHIWDSATNGGNINIIDENLINSAAFSPDGKYVVSGGDENTARVWDVTTGQEIAHATHESYVSSVVFSPDGQYVLSASDDGTARLWEAASGRELSRMTHKSGVLAIAFSPNGEYAISGGMDGTARVWETATGQELTRVTHKVYVDVVDFDSEGKYAVSGGCEDKGSNDSCILYTIRIWDARTGMEVNRITHNSRIDPIAFSLNRKVMAVGLCDVKSLFVFCIKGTIHVWDIARGEEIASINYNSDVSSIDLGRDGKYIVAGGCDILGSNLKCTQGSLQIWETITGKEITNIPHSSSVSSVFISPDGKYIASGWCDDSGPFSCSQSSVHLWIWRPEELIINACELMPRNLTRTEWEQYIGDALPYQAICENLPIESETVTTP